YWGDGFETRVLVARDPSSTKGPPTLWHQRQFVQNPLSPVLDGRLVVKRKKPVHEGPAQMTRLHRKPLRPFGYRLLNEAAGSGTGFALIGRLNGWAREVVWESHWSCKVAQSRRIAGIFPPRSGLVQVEISGVPAA